MKKILIIWIGVSILTSCNDYNKYNINNNFSNNVVKEEFAPQATIDVNVNFEPTIELTDEIRNTTLEELIQNDTRKLEINEFSYWFEGATKKVPASSNLAKVYYLERLHEFYALNHKYYNKVKRPSPKINNNTDTWKEYLQ